VYFIIMLYEYGHLHSIVCLNIVYRSKFSRGISQKVVGDATMMMMMFICILETYHL
jgi:hypothetical protein